ncbi:MFS transporter fmqE [Fusarium oxysporum f. sp. raphani]|uniref:Major facilitator superfamily (MFS) profile domain-containing protein n=2 Tax=Fusarium oxysporum TaxID=5507 RepID=A0A420M840_FUSOX|nr:MFS transporter fmqE [Fusarium oxysporum f. sp. raphani]RKK57407.1 hypothetical protein BFJ69_g17510 [Fusarium oxysporum]
MASIRLNEDSKSLDSTHKNVSHREVAIENEPSKPKFGIAQWKNNLRAFKKHKRLSLWCVAILMLLVNFGFDSPISGQALAFPAFRKDYGHYYAPSDDYVVSAMWQSLWAAANTIGIVLGGFVAGFTNDRYGRRFSFWINLTTSIATSFVLVFAPNVQTLFAAKLVFGISVGLSYTTAPLYVVENAPTEIRSTLMSFFNTFVVLGQFLAIVVTNPLSKVSGSWSYKGTFCLTFLFPAILIPILAFLPESPMWYIMKEREEDARKAILRLHGPLPADRLEEALLNLKENFNSVSRDTLPEEQPGWLEIFQGGNLRRTALLAVIYALQHCSGMPFVIPYQTYFYQLSGVEDAFAVSLGSFALMLAANFGALILPDFIGQRKVMVYGASLLMLWDVIIGAVGFAKAGNDATATVSVAFVASWAFFYQLTIGTMGFVVAPELPSQRMRAKTQAFGTIVANIIGWGIAFAIPYLFNPDQANLGARLLLIFVGLGTPLTLYLWVFLPETKNRSLGDLDELYSRGGRGHQEGGDTRDIEG